MVCRPPASWTPKPKMTAATISGSIARRDNSSTKSGFVKKLTTSSLMDTLLTSAADAAISLTEKPTGTMSMQETTPYISSEAISAVTVNVVMVMPMTLPARPAEPILAIAEAMDTKTIGTTMQNIILMNRSPSGLRPLASGQQSPTAVPDTMPISMKMTNP